MHDSGSQPDYTKLERRIAEWAEAQADILLALVVGSRAHQDHPADRWSDLDLILFTTKPRKTVSEDSWLANFGEAWLTYCEAPESEFPEWFAWYAGDLKGDFMLVQVPEGEAELEWQAQTQFGTQQDTWYDGRSFSEWADRRVLEALPDLFSTYSAADLKRALRAYLDLIRWLAQEVAQDEGLSYPSGVDQKVSAALEAMFEEKRGLA